jgi:Mg/Co/Ni transporter MgtE
MRMAVTHRADHAEFLNKLKPEQRAKVWQMIHEHANDYHAAMTRKGVKK